MLTNRTSMLPLTDTLALCSETTQAEGGGSCGQETPAIRQTISCARLRISSPTGVTETARMTAATISSMPMYSAVV